MKFLLDTNIISEWTKPRPDGRVVKWLSEADEGGLYLSVITLGELWQGIEGMAPGKRRASLARWVDQDVKARFGERLLEVDEAIARMWGTLLAQSRRKGKPMHAVDALLGATASVHSLTLVTRNVRDFAAAGIPLLDPFGETL